ncbi:signal peptide, CUB and EGF-like domain-containing protein 3 [Sycon ciliatum]|uniref:signal peptide, CUB and EGF-like domain-containing protein 3 n=1 Tax=Sycon ciliatum TaxID=27933 RepID=UPI0031F62441
MGRATFISLSSRLSVFAFASMAVFCATAFATCHPNCTCTSTHVTCKNVPVPSLSVFKTSTTNLAIENGGISISQDYGRFPNLTYLNLPLNAFSYVGEDQFQNITKLRILGLDHNTFREFPPKLLYSLLDLRLFGCRVNRLTYLPPNFFLKNRKITEIWIGYNQYKKLPFNLFTGLSVTHFHMSDEYNTMIDDVSMCPIAQVISRGPAYLDTSRLKLTAVDFMLFSCRGAHIGCYHDDNSTKFFCQCPSGERYYGRDLGCKAASTCNHTAQDLYTECSAHPTCTLISLTLGYSCSCQAGFSLSKYGSTCEQLNECLNSTLCAVNEVCEDTYGSYNCKCKQGYFRLHGGCKNANECAVNVSTLCAKNEVCIDTPGSYKCQCSTGFSETRGLCVDNNECNLTSSSAVTCPQNSTCLNTIGSYECRCDAGFQDILQPTSPTSPRCENIDECCNGQATCSADMQCNDTVGSYQCLCKTGFRWQDRLARCNDSDECSSSSSTELCPRNSACRNLVGSYYCLCQAGYQDMRTQTESYSPSTSVLCENVNECHGGSVMCGLNEHCNDTEGSYRCVCKAGFSLQGEDHVCENINECQTSAGNPCTDTSQCIDTDGSFVCLPTWRGEALFSSSTSSKASDSTTSTTAAVQIATLAVGTILLACAIANLLVVSKVRKQQQCDKRMHLENAKRDHEMQEVILHPRPGFPNHARLGNAQAEPSTVTANIGSTFAPHANNPRPGFTNINSHKARYQDTSRQGGLVHNEAYGFHPSTSIQHGNEHNPHLESMMSSPSFDEPDYEMTT